MCLPLQRKIGFSEIAPFIKDDVFSTKGSILVQCISCDGDMSWQPLTASKHSQVVKAACNSYFSSGRSDFKQLTDFHDLLTSGQQICIIIR